MRIRRILAGIYFQLKNIVDLLLGFQRTRRYFSSSYSKRIFLVGTPEHDNLGDHAIALAELVFVSTYFPDYHIVEVPIERFLQYWINLLLKVRRDDLFMISGGGNIGNIYVLDEKMRRMIISKFTCNPIVIMPQTIYFTDDKNGARELEISKRIYSSHPNLLICAREQHSYVIMKKEFINCNIKLCPDMVFSLNYVKPQSERIYIGICLRTDLESTLTEFQHREIESICHKYSLNVQHINTCLSTGLESSQREAALTTLFNQIKNCQLVVTDRLHGMIFSVITATPCIVFGSASHKIVSSFQWIKELPYIKFVSDTEGLYDCIQQLQSLKSNQYSELKYKPYFDALAAAIRIEGHIE